MPVNIHYFDTEGNCTNPKIENLNNLSQGNGYWLNEPFSLPSVYIYNDGSDYFWCMVVYESVHLAGPINYKLKYIFRYLDIILNTENEIKQFNLRNYRDILHLYQNAKSIKMINDILMPY